MAAANDEIPRRGTEKRQRTQLVPVRCTEAERAAIVTNAARAGMTVGAYMRHQAIGTAGPRALRRPQVDKVELARALGLIGLYGSNVNQLARAANMHGDRLAADQLEDLKRELRDMRGALRRALGYGD